MMEREYEAMSGARAQGRKLLYSQKRGTVHPVHSTHRVAPTTDSQQGQDRRREKHTR